MMLVFSEAASFYLSRFHPSFPHRFTPGVIRKLQACRHADIGKAKRELGYRPTTVRAAVYEAYAFHYQRGAITNPRAKPPNPYAARQAEDLRPDNGTGIPLDDGSI